jgi:hypothetical protein
MPTCLVLLTCALRTSAPAAVLFEDHFDGGLKPAWHVVTGEPRLLAPEDKSAEHVLELTPATKMMLRLDRPLRDVVMEAQVRFAEPRGWVEAPFLLRGKEDGAQALQVYLEQTSNRIIAVRFDNGISPLAYALPPVRLEIGPWYKLKVIAIDRRIGVWLNGQQVMGFIDERPRAGYVGIRVGDARTYYDMLRVSTPGQDDRKQLQLLGISGRLVPEVQEATLPLAGGAKATLRYPDIAEPLTPFEVRLETTAPGGYSLVASNQKLPLRPGEPLSLAFSGPEGIRTLTVLRDGQRIGSTEMDLRGDTFFEAGPFTDLFRAMRERVRGDRQTFHRKGRAIDTNPSWVRDHIHEMKGYKFWERDLTSYVDTLIGLQHPDGFFYEIIGEAAHDHQAFVAPRFVRIEKEDNLAFIRLEMEADVEYLMVEAAYNIWQATGDLASMRARLPALERAINYEFTDPTRWDAKHGALKRTFSIDTWDFTYGVPDTNRRIEPNMPMGIMHGDNSGLYQACRQLAAMYRAAGESARAEHWDKQAADLRERVNRLCFNGRYYTHQVLLQPVSTGVKEEDILSLSNTYDINRGLPTHEMAVKIIDEYQARRQSHEKTHFAEWFSIDPPYPKFGPYTAGKYINGGIAGFVAGELARAAFNHGREAYGADILARVARKVDGDGTIFFLYTADGQDMGGGPRGWSAAAVISAMVEGLAGIQDDDVQFRRITVSPRFVAAGIDRARVCARYGPTGAYVSLGFEHRAADRTIVLSLAGMGEKTHVRMLLPAGVSNVKSIALVRGGTLAPGSQVTTQSAMPGQIEAIEQSHYVAFDLSKPLTEGVCEMRVEY